jgi:hypothetical protein
MLILSDLSFIISTSNTKRKFRYQYLLQNMHEAAATSNKGPVIWCILLVSFLSRHASLGCLSANFMNG